MRILLATGIFPPEIGGPATYTKLIAEELTKLGHEVVVVTYGEKSKVKIKNVSRGLPKGIRHFVYFWKVLMHGKRADVIYAQDPVSAGLPALWAARLLRKKFLVRVAGDYAWEQGMQRFGVMDLLDDFVKKTYGTRVERLRRAQQKVARAAYRVIVPSEYLKRIVMTWGVSEDKIAVIYSVVEQHPLPDRKKARAALGFAENDTILFSIGRLVPWKGFEMLVRIFPEVKKQFQAKFVIVGDGPMREKLATSAKQNGVIMTGAVSADRIAEYLVSADVFLLNTAYEGFSHQILEAFVAGTPVVTTLAGGNAEIVHDSENALVAPYNDEAAWTKALLRICGDQALRERLKIGGYASIGEYSVERMINKLQNILENT